MNTQKILTIGLAANSLLIVAILIWLVQIGNNKYAGDLENPAPMANKSATATAANIPASQPLIAETAEITINDTGFENIGFSAQTGEIIALTIKNIGQKNHSLKIDDLNFDSGVITPGETKTAQLPALSSEPRDYQYYSGIDGKIDGFTGILMVLQK